MNHGITSLEDLFECFAADQAEETDDSFLELLCEDGFLDISDLCEEDFPGHRLILLRRAVRRGFQETGHPPERLSDDARRIVKRSATQRRWNDVVSQVSFLRAPPYFARCGNFVAVSA